MNPEDFYQPEIEDLELKSLIEDKEELKESLIRDRKKSLDELENFIKVFDSKRDEN